MATTPNWQGTAEMVRRVSSARGRRQTGLYSIEGFRLVERAVRAGVTFAAALIGERFIDSAVPRAATLLDDLRAAGCPVIIAPDATVEELTEGRDLGPILALLRLPEPPSLARLLETDGAPPVFLVALDIVDPGNVGAMVRTAHASGAAALLASGASDPFHPRATQTSRGSLFKLPVIHYPTAIDLLRQTRQSGIAIIGTVANAGRRLPDVVLPAGPLAVVMGNEAEGLGEEALALMDHLVTIPMPAGVDSFAVNAAAAIVLYELTRQRLVHRN